MGDAAMASAGVVDLVCFGYNPWSRMWKRNQQMVAALARTPWIRRVLFVNPEARVEHLVKHPLRELRSPARERWRGLLPRTVDAKIRVFTPCRLPYASRLALLEVLTHRLLCRLAREHAERGFLLLVNGPTDPDAASLRYLFERAVLRIFDWSDDFEEFAVDAAERAWIRRACEYYLRRCDLVFTVNDRLGERARRLNRHVETIPNATSFPNFSRASTPDLAVAGPMRRLRRPIVGYVGWLTEQRLDQEILEHLTASRPEWSFVFIGPKASPRPLDERIARRPNVHLLRPVAYHALPGYLKAFDVCIIPNRINAFTDGNDPIKVYDYLATGKPIVSTRTSGVDRFAGLIRIADDGPAFLAAVEETLERDTAGMRQARLEAAREHSWEARMAVVTRLILERAATTAPPAPVAPRFEGDLVETVSGREA